MSSTPTRITHLINGLPWEGTAERTSPVFNPATGVQTGELDLASADLVGEVVTAAHEAWASGGAASRWPSAPRCSSSSASCSTSARRTSPR